MSMNRSHFDKENFMTQAQECQCCLNQKGEKGGNEEKCRNILSPEKLCMQIFHCEQPVQKQLGVTAQRALLKVGSKSHAS